MKYNKLKNGDVYYVLDLHLKDNDFDIREVMYKGSDIDRIRFEYGFGFYTKEQLLRRIKILQNSWLKSKA